MSELQLSTEFKIDAIQVRAQKILHCGDVHFFQNKRWDEYNQLTDELCKIIIDHEIDLVYIGGDIIDSKTKMSPEQLTCCRRFFKEISKLVPIVILIGNHDTNLQNRKRMDSITSILNTIENPAHRIDYFKESGLYSLYGVSWAIWSCLDDKNPFDIGHKPYAYDAKEDFTIGCYHGLVQEATLDNNYSGFTASQSVSDFNDCDVVFLNDIHKRQSFRDGQIQYSGSWTQTKVNEDEDKGVLIWEWSEKEQTYKADYVSIPKTFGYRTYEVEDLDKFDVPKDKLPREYVARLSYTGDANAYNQVKFNELKKELQEQFDTKVVPHYKPFNSSAKKQVVINKKDDNTDFFKIYFKQKHDCDDGQVTVLKEIDAKYEKLIDQGDYETGQYDLEEMTVHNFLSFGEGNVINFAALRGLTGIFAANRVGKSSVLDAVMWCLFNRISKGSKLGRKLINDQIIEEGTEAYVELILSVQGIRWRIKRTLVASKKSATNSLELWETVGKKEVPRHDESITKTEPIIKKMFGDVEIFRITALCTQKNNAEFVHCTNSERLDLFLKFLGITAYEKKDDICKEDLKKDNAKLDQLLTDFQQSTPKGDLQSEIDQLKEDNEGCAQDLEDIEEEVVKFTTAIEDKQQSLSQLAVVDVAKTQEDLQIEFDEHKDDLTQHLTEEYQLNEKITTVSSEWEEIYRPEFDCYMSDWKPIDKYLKESREAQALAIKISHAKTELEAGETCPTCNQKRKDYNEAELQETVDELSKEYTILQGKCESWDELQTNAAATKQRLANYKVQMEGVDAKIALSSSKIETCEAQLQILKDNELKITQRAKLQSKIDILQASLDETKEEKSTITIEMNNNATRITQCGTEITKYDEQYQAVVVKQAYVDALALYRKGLARTAIPALILDTYIPEINFELNDTMQGLFPFNIYFELDGKKLEIYNQDNLVKKVKRDIALSSGMEGFSMNLAIRSSLSRVSLLPKPSLFMIDEGFDALDGESLELIKEMISTKLREQYDNMLLITHRDDLKDLPEHMLNLEKIDGITSVVD